MLYISGKITASNPKEQNKNIQLFVEKERELKALGFTVHNPASFTDQSYTWEQYLARDLLFIVEHRPKIYVLPNWQESKGARLEIAMALLLGLEIVYGPRKDK